MDSYQNQNNAQNQMSGGRQNRTGERAPVSSGQAPIGFDPYMTRFMPAQNQQTNNAGGRQDNYPNRPAGGPSRQSGVQYGQGQNGQRLVPQNPSSGYFDPNGESGQYGRMQNGPNGPMYPNGNPNGQYGRMQNGPNGPMNPNGNSNGQYGRMQNGPNGPMNPNGNSNGQYGQMQNGANRPMNPNGNPNGQYGRMQNGPNGPMNPNGNPNGQYGQMQNGPNGPMNPNGNPNGQYGQMQNASQNVYYPAQYALKTENKPAPPAAFAKQSAYAENPAVSEELGTQPSAAGAPKWQSRDSGSSFGAIDNKPLERPEQNILPKDGGADLSSPFEKNLNSSSLGEQGGASANDLMAGWDDNSGRELKDDSGWAARMSAKSSLGPGLRSGDAPPSYPTKKDSSSYTMWFLAAGILFLSVAVFLALYHNKDAVVGENLPENIKNGELKLSQDQVLEFTEKDPVSKNRVSINSPYRLDVYGTTFVFENEANLMAFVNNPLKYVKPKIKVRVSDVEQGEGKSNITIVGKDGRPAVEGVPQIEEQNSAPAENPVIETPDAKEEPAAPDGAFDIPLSPQNSASDNASAPENNHEEAAGGAAENAAPEASDAQVQVPQESGAPGFGDVPPPEADSSLSGQNVSDEEVVPPPVQ